MKHLQAKAVLLLLLALSPAITGAKDIRELWKNMPDSITPYLDSSLREECLHIYDNQSTAKTKNKLKGETVIDSIGKSFLRATLNESATIEMKVLPSADGDSLICLIKTFRAPQKESTVTIYSQDWKKQKTIIFDNSDLLARPDTMTASDFDKYKTQTDSFLISAEFEQTGDAITVTLSPTITFPNGKGEPKAVSLLRRFKWNGTYFKEC